MASAHAAWPSVIANTSTVQTTTARCQFPISSPYPCGIDPRHLSPATGSSAASVGSIVACLHPICHALCEAVVLYWLKNIIAERLPEEARTWETKGYIQGAMERTLTRKAKAW